MSNVIILGSGGFLSRHLGKKYPKAIQIKREECDITKINEIENVVKKYSPELIINCAAITNVKFCEENKDKAREVNVNGVKNIYEVAKKHDIYTVHFSSDYALHPVNEYSRTKRESESFVYGLVIRTNFFDETHWLIQSLKENKKIELIEDMSFNPITVYSLIDYLDVLIKNKNHGIVNIGTKEKISYFKLGKNICKEFNYDQNLISINNDLEPGYNYPKNTYLELDFLKENNYDLITIEQDLRRMKNEIKK